MTTIGYYSVGLIYVAGLTCYIANGATNGIYVVFFVYDRYNNLDMNDASSVSLATTLATSGCQWTCPSCVLEHDALQHDERCLKCEQMNSLIADISAICELALHDAKKAGTSTDAPEWGIVAVKGVDDALQAYVAHLVRDVNQSTYQPWCFEQVEKHEHMCTDLMDYWAKQKEKKSKTATCEGVANIGVSCHGRMYTYKNPSTATRAMHPGVPWASSYPKPPEEGGPAMCREFRRSWSDSSHQTAFETASTMLAEDLEFRDAHPWLATSIGTMSDGASNYHCSHSAMFNLLSPFINAKCTSVEGMGKDEIDRDNGSTQGKINAARATKDMTYSVQFMSVCNARRHKGEINARVEGFDYSLDMSKTEKASMKPIDQIGELKLHDTSGSSPHKGLVSWELFSRRLSSIAGRPVGYGPGRVTSAAVLREKHALDSHKLPAHGADLTFEGTESLEAGQDERHNAAPCLSKQQKKDAAAAAEAMKDARDANKKQRAEAAANATAATYDARRLVCPDCNVAKFSSARWLAKHRANKCGRFAKGVERRRTHDAGTITALVKLHDDDLADEAEAAETAGLDVNTVTFTAQQLLLGDHMSLGWTLAEQLDGSTTAPSTHAGLTWAAPTDANVGPGEKVRISAVRFEADAQHDFGPDWRFAYYYGWCRGCGDRASGPGTVKIEYTDDGGVFDSHFSHIEVGTVTEDVVVLDTRRAVIKARTTGGAAHRFSVLAGIGDPIGRTICSVGGVSTESYAKATTELRRAMSSGALPIDVVLRRAPPPATSLRGQARSAAHRRTPHVWHDDVAETMDELMKNPANQRRNAAVYDKLKATYGHALGDDGRLKLPPRKDVDARMLNLWKKRQKEARAAAQDAGARALARALGGGGGGGADDEDEPISSDEEEDGGDDRHGGGDDGRRERGDGDAARAATGDAAAAAAAAETTANAEEEIFKSLDGSKAADLRTRLRSLGESTLATVKADDLPIATPDTGPAKSAAVILLLRRRLARVLAERAVE